MNGRRLQGKIGKERQQTRASYFHDTIAPYALAVLIDGETRAIFLLITP